MKKFQFSLAGVLSFRERELEELTLVHGQMLAEIATQQERIDKLQAGYDAEVQTFDEKKRLGITVMEAQSLDSHITGLLKQMNAQRHILAQMQVREAEQRRKVVEKKKEVSSIEKLREKKMDEYNIALQKEEESLIEEIVLNRRSAAV